MCCRSDILIARLESLNCKTNSAPPESVAILSRAMTAFRTCAVYFDVFDTFVEHGSAG